MITRQPQLLTLQNMFDTLSKDNSLPTLSFFKGGLGVAVNMSQFLQPFIRDTPSPYLLEDYRIGYIKQGYMHGIINLQEYTITAGHAVFITPGTIVEPLNVSDDFLIIGMGVQHDLFHIAHSGKLPHLFCGKQKHGILAVGGQEATLIDHLFRMLCEMASTQEHITETTHHLMAAITAYYDTLFEGQADSSTAHRATSNDLFDRFIQLVNRHCREQRRLDFYADKLCLTERYLGTVIRQTSGITAKEWIDRAVITAAKVMLRHDNKQVAEISDHLHFATPSFFCKYFKRLVGQTPQEYRQEGSACAVHPRRPSSL